MPSSETFDVILRLLMDDAAMNRIKSGASSVAKEFEKVDDKTEEVTKEIQRQEKIAIAAMKQEAGAIRKVAAARAKAMSELKGDADDLDRAFKPMFAAGVAGFTAITLLARKYIETTDESNEITKAWAASTEKVNDAQMRIGKVAAEAVLPLYEKLASIAEKGADFIEKNPGAIEAGLKASMVLAGLGGLGMLATKGMRLYADYKMMIVGEMQLSAANIMAAAAKQQLAAAGGGSGVAKGFGIGGTTAAAKGAIPTVTGGAATVAGGSAVATAAQAAMVIAAPIVAGVLTKELINGIQRAAGAEETTWAQIGTTLSQAIQLPVKFALLGLSSVAPEAAAKINELQNSLWAWTGATAANNEAMAQNTAAVNEASATAAKNGAMVTQSFNSAGSSMARAAGTANGVAQASNQMSSSLVGFGSSISNFIQRIISSFRGGTTTPVHDYTGYAYTRTYAMAQDGKRQFVMSGDMTRIAEQMLGGQLNQQMVLSALSGGGNSRVVWQDQRRFSGEYSKAMRNAQRADTLDIFAQIARELK